MWQETLNRLEKQYRIISSAQEREKYRLLNTSTMKSINPDIATTDTKAKVSHVANSNGYVPAPVDVSDIELPEELDEVVELIAKNVHEVWAKERMDEGWTYGSVRNDKLKTHPCLIPYEELPEIEKEYDRNTAFGTMRYIRKLGFKVSKE